jgi:PAS domain S-box-containing protein
VTRAAWRMMAREHTMTTQPGVHQQSSERSIAPAPDSEELLRLVVESATDFAIFSTDPAGLVTSWNSGAERVLRFAEADIMGRSADVVFTPEDRAAGVPEWERQQALANGRAEDERWSMRADGSRFFASGLMMPLADASLGFVKILRDRTAHHEKEARLQESEERFRLLATNIPQLVFRTQPDGTRTWGSPQWIDFTGLSLEDSLGHGWLDAIHPDDLEATQVGWEEARRVGEYYVEHRVRRAPDGEYCWHQTRARPVEGGEDSQNLDWVGTMTDIHDLRTLQDRQQVLMAELQHRTRNLLAVTQAIASQTLRRSETMKAFGEEFEGRLRALSRVQALLARTDHHDVDLHALVMAELSAHADGELGHRVRVEGPSVVLAATSAQAVGLALHELATNAVKYGALLQQDGRLDVIWREQAEGAQRRVVLDWIESGVVMPAGGRPTHRGYGSELITRALPNQLGARSTLEFGADGVRCMIAVPLGPGGAP